MQKHLFRKKSFTDKLIIKIVQKELLYKNNYVYVKSENIKTGGQKNKNIMTILIWNKNSHYDLIFRSIHIILMLSGKTSSKMTFEIP